MELAVAGCGSEGWAALRIGSSTGPHTVISLSAQKSVHLQSRTSRRGDGQDLGRPHPSRLTWRSASGHLGDVLPPIWDSRVFSYNAIPGCVFFEEAKDSSVLSGYAY